MKLIDKQLEFCPNIARLILYAINEASIRHNVTIQVRFAEGYVGDSIDKASEDTPHLRYGTHFLRIGQDLILHIDGVMITKVKGDSNGPASHPKAYEIYIDLITYWLSLNKYNRAGGTWKKQDFAHWSMEHNGVA